MIAQDLSLALALLLALVVLPTMCGVGALVFAGSFLNQFQLERLKGRDSVRNWLKRGVPFVLLLTLVAGLLVAGGIAIAAARPELGASVVVALGLSVVLLLPTYALASVGASYRFARDTWARDAGLTDDDVIAGVREIVNRGRWSLLAITCVLNGSIAALVFLFKQGPGLGSPPFVVIPLGVGAVSTWLGLKLVDMAHPVAEFLETVGRALRQGANREVSSATLRRHQARQWGAGGATVLQALPALQRSVSSMLRSYPALSEETVRTNVTPLFNELADVAVSGAATKPCAAIGRAVRLALLNELPTPMHDQPRVRPLDDVHGWNQAPSFLPGEIGRWVPHKAELIWKLMVGFIAVAGVVAGIVVPMFK